MVVSDDARNKKGSRWCDHCQRPNHTKATCWKLHRKPADWVPLRLSGHDGKAPNISSSIAAASDVPFSKAQLDHLIKILHNSNLDASGSSLMARTGTLTTDLVGQTEKGEPWIIDSGASNHMTRDLTQLQSIFPCS